MKLKLTIYFYFMWSIVPPVLYGIAIQVPRDIRWLIYDIINLTMGLLS